ncbi:MAG: hypothetical protein ACQEQV_00745 [Fibrobacterota bacterium]
MTAYSEDITQSEAHLYAGVAKADGIISRQEYTQVPYYARKSQKFFDMMGMNRETADRIGPAIRRILSAPQYKEWTSEDHLQEALRLSRKASEQGFWQSNVTFQKNEEGFTNAARIGGYNIKEARFIRRMEELLAQSD